MLTIHSPQNTNPNESGVQFSTDISSDLRTAFTDAGIDLGSVRVDADDTIRITAAGGGRVAIGEDEGWITATAYDADGDETLIFEGTSLSDLAAVVAERAR